MIHGPAEPWDVRDADLEARLRRLAEAPAIGSLATGVRFSAAG